MAKVVVELVIASNNQHKVSEIREMAPPGFIFFTLGDKNFTRELPETSGTIRGNALQKARTFWELSGSNCLADDSGLMVEALDGKPGVDSAFYAGLPRNDEKNVEKLLADLKGKENRKAQFITVMALIVNDKEYVFTGEISGHIAEKPLGAQGFGYDPVFIPEGESRTFAQMNPEEKNKMSHRSRALSQVIQFLKETEF